MELLDAIKPIIKWVIKKIFLGWIFIWLWNKFIKQIIQEIEKRNDEILKNKKNEIELEKEKREHESTIKINEEREASKIKINEEREASEIRINEEREKELDDILLDNSLDNDEKRKAIEVLSSNFSDKRKEQLNKLMPLYCDKQSGYTPDEYSKFHKLFSEYFFQNITDKKRKLIETLMKKVDTISTKAIWFLLALDDNEIEILKKQFCYVFSDIGILYYNNIEQNFHNKGLNVKRNQSRLKFVNEIWQYNDSGDFIMPLQAAQAAQVRRVAAFKERVIIEHPSTNKELSIKGLCHLTDLGQELYPLFEEEIEEVPNDYIEKLMEYLHQNHQGHQFKIEKNSQDALNSLT